MQHSTLLHSFRLLSSGRKPKWEHFSILFNSNGFRGASKAFSTQVPGNDKFSESSGGEEASKPQLSEQAKLDQESLLQQFGLLTIPEDINKGAGVEIDSVGQLSITDLQKARRPYKTILALCRAPRSLSERDFLQIILPGKHLGGWITRAGLEQIIPVRNTKTFEKTDGWLLVFSNPESAREFQSRALHLRETLKKNSPFYPASDISLPPTFVDSKSQDVLQDYTLSSPWQHPVLSAVLYPFDRWTESVMEFNEALTSPTSSYGVQSSTISSPTTSAATSSGYPVLFSVSQHRLLHLSVELVLAFIHWDGRSRCVPWKISEGEDKVICLYGQDIKTAVIQTRGSFTEKSKFGDHDVSSWRIMFQSASEARRFVRSWNRREFPHVSGTRGIDPPPMIYADALFSESI
ncbi:hypothetical protein FQN57_000468 [Myotisia sp. PD_48]|nr:hypothetical protein FQN57_000468 [Myotisia sp. PD_48]